MRLIKGIVVAESSLNISYLQFADDTIIFLEHKVEYAMILRRLLWCFRLLSGLSINFFKLKAYQVGVEAECARQMAVSMGRVLDQIPFSYLGMPLGANPNRISTREPVIRRVKERLALWQRKFLSFGGRVTLIKSVFNSLPLYYLSIFKAPRSVIKILE
ncbi:hypothetical protein CRYUN_Cryun24cG0038800 [Craigia yunnanensis]